MCFKVMKGFYVALWGCIIYAGQEKKHVKDKFKEGNQQIILFLYMKSYVHSIEV